MQKKEDIPAEKIKEWEEEAAKRFPATMDKEATYYKRKGYLAACEDNHLKLQAEKEKIGGDAWEDGYIHGLICNHRTKEQAKANYIANLKY